MTEARGLTITIVDVDEDYLGIDVRAWNARFGGTARIYAAVDGLSELADRIAGFPSSPDDARVHQFGTLDAGVAGGCCTLRFRCVDGAGHARLDIVIDDDDRYHELGEAKLGFRFHAADLDRFCTGLRNLERDRRGQAHLPMAT